MKVLTAVLGVLAVIAWIAVIYLVWTGIVVAWRKASAFISERAVFRRDRRAARKYRPSPFGPARARKACKPLTDDERTVIAEYEAELTQPADNPEGTQQ